MKFSKSVLGRVKVSEHIKKYALNTGWLFFEKIFRIFANVFVGIYVARYLGENNYGVFNVALAIVALLTPFAGLGIHGVLVRDIINHPESRDKLLGTSFFLRLFGAIATMLILAIIIFFLKSEERLITGIIGFGLVIQTFQVIDLYFQAKVMSKYIVICQTASLIISSILRLVFVFWQFPLVYFAIASLVEMSILSIGYIYFYVRNVHTIRSWHFDTDWAVKLLKESWPLIMSGFLIAVYMRIDQVMIQGLLSLKEVGDYSAAIKISEAYYFLPAVLCNSLFPAIVNGKKIGEEEYQKRLLKLYYILTWLSVSIALFITIFAEPIAYLCFKDKFHHVGTVLSWHVWAGVFVFWGTASGKWLTIERIQIYDTFNTILGGVINIALNFILLPRIGVVGAAIATLIAYGFAGFLGFAVFKKSRPPFIIILKSFNIFRMYKTFKNA